MRRNFGIVLLLFMINFFSIALHAASLDGTSTLVYQDEHYVFRSDDIAQGFVKLNDGFTILQDESATLDTVITVSGDIDLRVTGTMILGSDLYLSSNVTFTNEGDIFGNGFALHLGGNLTIPENVTLHVINDLVIDGGGCSISFGPHAQLLVDCNATLTIKNTVICNTRNTLSCPFIRLAQDAASLALDNVILNMQDDFSFSKGHLYIHNDVHVTGTSRFLYNSAVSSFIAGCSQFYFDKDTTFFYNPATDSKDLLLMQDETSDIVFNNATLQSTHTGFRLIRGRMCLDNCVTLSSAANTVLDRVELIDREIHGTGGGLHCLDIHPDGQYILLSGPGPTTIDGSSTNNEIQLYRFDRTNTNTLDGIRSRKYGEESKVIIWSPDGRYFAVNGYLDENNPSQNKFDGNQTEHEIHVYRFNTVTTELVGVTSRDFTDVTGVTQTGREVRWSPDGKFLAVGGSNASEVGGFSNTNEIRLYSFNGLDLLPVASREYGDRVSSMHWSPDGEYLAVVGNDPANPGGGFSNDDQLRIYRFTGSSLAPTESYQVAGGVSVRPVKWSPDGKFIAIGTNSASEGVKLLSFDRATETVTLVGTITSGDTISALGWSPDSRYLAIGSSGSVMSGVGGFDNTHPLRIYQINTSEALFLPVTSYDTEGNVNEVAWAPDGSYLGVFSTKSGTKFLEILQAYYRFDTREQPFGQGICFGDASQGEEADLDVTLNSGARVCVNGVLNYDPAS